jgi:hypothetical protein
MVAIKTGKLNARDIWPDILWDDMQWHAKRDEFEAKLRAEGVTDHIKLFFAISRAMEAYGRQFPKMSERQRVMQAIYPLPKAKAPVALSEEEVAYLIERLAGVNDPIGQGMREKLEKWSRPS